MMKTFSVKTHHREELIDITHLVNKVISEGSVSQGTAVVFIPHTTAGVTINENADPDVVHDILLTLGELIPQHHSSYLHGEGNSDAHTKASLTGSSVTVIVDNGRMVLGTWQGIYFCEFDGPRSRKVFVRLGV